MSPNLNSVHTDKSFFHTFLGVLTQARCEKCESVDTPTTSALRALNSEIRSLNAMISVGHTNVLKRKKESASL